MLALREKLIVREEEQGYLEEADENEFMEEVKKLGLRIIRE